MLKNVITGFLVGFGAVAARNAVKSNNMDAAAMANGDFALRQRLATAGDGDALYEDWKKYGPRWQNGYFVPSE